MEKKPARVKLNQLQQHQVYHLFLKCKRRLFSGGCRSCTWIPALQRALVLFLSLKIASICFKQRPGLERSPTSSTGAWQIAPWGLRVRVRLWHTLPSRGTSGGTSFPAEYFLVPKSHNRKTFPTTSFAGSLFSQFCFRAVLKASKSKLVTTSFQHSRWKLRINSFLCNPRFHLTLHVSQVVI